MEPIVLAGRIKELREAKGYTINKLASQAGISQSFLRDIELGNKKPTVDTLDAICWALDISLSDFFDVERDILSEEIRLQIYRLNPEQRQALLVFLKSLP